MARIAAFGSAEERCGCREKVNWNQVVKSLVTFVLLFSSLAMGSRKLWKVLWIKEA
jgi:hypothetical protein